MKTRRRIWYWLFASLAISAILGFAGAYAFLPPPKGSLAEVKWECGRDEASADRGSKPATNKPNRKRNVRPSPRRAGI